MEVCPGPGLSFYNNVQDGTALVTNTLESTNHLTPLHIPPGPPISPERYKELENTFQLCKPVLKAGQESGGNEPMLPESHRNYEPPYKFDHKHEYYGNTRDAPLRPCDMPGNIPEVEYMNYAKYMTPGTFLVEGRYRPRHPYVHCKYRKDSFPKIEHAGEDQSQMTRDLPAEHGAFHVSQYGEGNNQTHDSQLPAIWPPKTALKLPELDISPRAANMLKNVKQALWLSSYKRDFSGRGPMNPLLLDDYDVKLIGRTTGELGKNVELKESFPSGTSQVRPLEGRIARTLQGRQRETPVFYQQDPPDVQSPPLHSHTMNSVVFRDSEAAQNSKEMSLIPFQHDSNASGAWRRDEYFLPDHIKLHIEYPKANTEDKRPPWHPLQKITDTWKTEHLYQRQLAIPPEPEPIPRPEDPVYYEDLPPSRLNGYIVWHHPVFLSKPGPPPDLCFEKPIEIYSSSLTSHPKDIATFTSYSSQPKDVTTLPSFPEWANSGVARPKTKLMDIQDSFSKNDVISRLNDLRRKGIRDLRDHDREGRRHKFQGTHAYFFD